MRQASSTALVTRIDASVAFGSPQDVLDLQLVADGTDDEYADIVVVTPDDVYLLPGNTRDALSWDDA